MNSLSRHTPTTVCLHNQKTWLLSFLLHMAHYSHNDSFHSFWPTWCYHPVNQTLTLYTADLSDTRPRMHHAVSRKITVYVDPLALGLRAQFWLKEFLQPKLTQLANDDLRRKDIRQATGISMVGKFMKNNWNSNDQRKKSAVTLTVQKCQNNEPPFVDKKRKKSVEKRMKFACRTRPEATKATRWNLKHLE